MSLTFPQAKSAKLNPPKNVCLKSKNLTIFLIER